MKERAVAVLDDVLMPKVMIGCVPPAHRGIVPLPPACVPAILAARH